MSLADETSPPTAAQALEALHSLEGLVPSGLPRKDWERLRDRLAYCESLEEDLAQGVLALEDDNAATELIWDAFYKGQGL